MKIFFALLGAILVSWVTQHLIQNVTYPGVRDWRGDDDFMFYIVTMPFGAVLGAATATFFSRRENKEKMLWCNWASAFVLIPAISLSYYSHFFLVHHFSLVRVGFDLRESQIALQADAMLSFDTFGLSAAWALLLLFGGIFLFLREKRRA